MALVLTSTAHAVRHVPEWFPGTGWKKKVPKYRKTLQDMFNLPYDWVKQQAVRLSSWYTA